RDIARIPLPRYAEHRDALPGPPGPLSAPGVPKPGDRARPSLPEPDHLVLARPLPQNGDQLLRPDGRAAQGRDPLDQGADDLQPVRDLFQGVGSFDSDAGSRTVALR